MNLIDVAREALYARALDLRYAPPHDDTPAKGVFVTLRSPDGSLRGCIGHLGPTRNSLAEEVASVAPAAGFEDPRFPPVSEGELTQLDVEISVLEPPEPCAGEHELDPDRYGVIVTSGHRRGVLLPDIEGVTTARQQVDIALRKAGIRRGEPFRLQRFVVTKIA